MCIGRPRDSVLLAGALGGGPSSLSLASKGGFDHEGLIGFEVL